VPLVLREVLRKILRSVLEEVLLFLASGGLQRFIFFILSCADLALIEEVGNCLIGSDVMLSLCQLLRILYLSASADMLLLECLQILLQLEVFALTITEDGAVQFVVMNFSLLLDLGIEFVSLDAFRLDYLLDTSLFLGFDIQGLAVFRYLFFDYLLLAFFESALYIQRLIFIDFCSKLNEELLVNLLQIFDVNLRIVSELCPFSLRLLHLLLHCLNI
jgi:hypothetical protein